MWKKIKKFYFYPKKWLTSPHIFKKSWIPFESYLFLLSKSVEKSKIGWELREIWAHNPEKVSKTGFLTVSQDFEGVLQLLRVNSCCTRPDQQSLLGLFRSYFWVSHCVTITYRLEKCLDFYACKFKDPQKPS